VSFDRTVVWQWRYVHVDDRIPCTRAGKPYFVRSRDLHEAWPVSHSHRLNALDTLFQPAWDSPDPCL
jgi:hypothetical protein